MARHRDSNWNLPENLTTWEQVSVAVLMDIREFTKRTLDEAYRANNLIVQLKEITLRSQEIVHPIADGMLSVMLPADSRYKLSVLDLEMPVRATNLLETAGIITVGALVEQSAADLLELRNCGQTTLRDIRDALARKGLALRGEQVEGEPHGHVV